DIVVHEFVEPLGPMQPVITTFEFGSEKTLVVPTIHRQPRQEKSSVMKTGPPQNSCHTVFKPLVFQFVQKEPCEIRVLLWKCKRVGKGTYCRTKLLFDDLFRISEFVFDLLRSQAAEVRVRHGVGAKPDPLLVQFTYFAPRQVIDALQPHRCLLDAACGKKNGCRESAAFQDWHC